MNPGPEPLNSDEVAFIKEHISANTAELALKYHGDKAKTRLIGQIKSRQKIRKKLPEWFGNEQLIFPEGLPLEQASSEETARLKSGLISGNYLLDITGGLGVDTFYMSGSFHKTTYVEQNPALAEITRFNLNALQSDIEVVNGDGREVLMKSEADFVYIDPYRRDDFKQKVVALDQYQPDVSKLLDVLTANGRKSLIKTSPMLDISAALVSLRNVAEVWVISVKNDCKEVNYLLSGDLHKNVVFKTFNLDGPVEQSFQSENGRKGDIQTGKIERYVYEPNASILKAGIQDLVPASFEVHKLHLQSNFFTSPRLLNDFPGRIFEVDEVLKAWDKSLKGGRYNVISRNFPDKANIIEKKLRLKPSKDDFLLATRLYDDSYKFIKAKLIRPVAPS